MKDNKNNILKGSGNFTVLITGGCGFIGSHVVRRFVKQYPQYLVINVDKLTYAGNPENLVDIHRAPNSRSIKADVCDHAYIEEIFRHSSIDAAIHLAA